MPREFVRPAGWIASVLVTAGALAGCASLEAYSRRNVESMCPNLYQCFVYDDSGKHASACWDGAGRKPTIFPGDPDWPFNPGVCPPLPEQSPLASEPGAAS